MRGVMLAALALAGCDSVKILSDDSGGVFGDDTGRRTGGSGVTDCDGAYDNSPPDGPDCVTASIACGETVTGTTEGGGSQFTLDLYQSAYCFVPFENYDGPERVYALDLPADTLAEIDVDTSCEDMGFAALKWDPSTCPPNEGHNITICEGLQYGTGGSVDITPFDTETRHLLVVDAPSGTEAAFTIEVTCQSR
ncbi:MAG: hypothetical protein H6739_41360 [Alphaproteobacteria bacterium]|nr:hypothetical protein [Alphaproteobacteria bacterium]